MKKNKKFNELRKLMACMGVTYKDIVDAWNIEHPDTCKYESWFSALMCGHKDWTLEVAYFVLDYIGVSHTMLNVYFPKGGVDDE